MRLKCLRSVLSFLFIFAWLWAAAPAHAIPIESGQIVTGSVSGANLDTYTFSVQPGDTVFFSASGVGTPTESMYAQLFDPSGSLVYWSFDKYNVSKRYVLASGGTWSLKMGVWLLAAGPVNYKFTVIVIPSATAMPFGGGSMYPSVTYNGSITRGTVDVYQFQGIAGGSNNTTLTFSALGAAFPIQAYVTAPDGADEGGNYAGMTPTTYQFSNYTYNGPMTVLVWSAGFADGTVPYTITATGSGIGMPTEAQADGSFCIPCVEPDGGTSPSAAGGMSVGDPINPATGNLFESVTDYTTVGQNPLAFTRSYNSLSYTRNLYPTLMGANWRTNYDRYLRLVSSTQVAAERPDGQVVNFTLSGGTWKPDAAFDYSLGSSGSTWTLTDADDTAEIYFASGGKATLNSIRQRNGYTQAINYSSGQISFVSDSYNRQLGFSYASTGRLSGVTTPDAMNLTYGYINYASTGLLQTVSYNTSPVQSQTYLYENADKPYALTGLINENGVRYSSWGYDGAGRAISSQLAGGVDFTSVSYDDATGNSTVTGPLGIQETYKFTTMQGVPKVARIDRSANGAIGAASRLFTYSSTGYMSSRTDWNGNQTAFTTNGYGLPTQIVYASGSPVSHTTTIAYDTTWPRLAKTITTPGVTTGITYDSNGNMLTATLTDTTTQSVPYSTNGQTRTWTYTYNSTGQLLSAQLPRTDVTAKTTYGYTGGLLTSVTDALGHATTVSTWKNGGQPKNVTDPNGVLTAFAWNSRLRLTSITTFTSAGSLVTGLNYSSAGDVTKATLADGSYLTYAYNNARQLTTVTNRLSETQGITYDSAGNVTQTLWKNASAVTTRQHTATYDALGRMLTDVGGVGQSTALTYDSNSNILTVTNPLSRVSSQGWDALNRPKSFTDAAVNFTSVSYDAHDRPVAVKDPKGNTTTYIYNGFGDLIQQTSPDSGTTVWVYDPDGNVTQRTDATGAVTNYTWDALDRPLTRAYPADGTLNVTYNYDQAGHGYGVGQLTTLRDQAGCSSRDYDARGLMTRDVRIVGGTGTSCTGGNSYTTGYTYESAGRLSGITYGSGGWLVSYARDNAGQVTTVTTTQPSMSPVNLATSVTHMPFGPVKSLTWGNGVTDTRTFDLDYRMTSVKDVGTGNIQYVSYGYDADDNLLTWTDNVTPGNNQTLAYDVLSRINYASGPYGTVSSITYDSNSNRTAYGATSYTIPSTSNKMSNAGGSSVTYTNAGNIKAIGADTFFFNKENQLSQATVSGTVTTFTYDAAWNRLRAATGATQAHTLYGQDSEVLFQSTGGIQTNYAYLDGMPLAVIQPAAATLSMIHTDRLGTPQRATNASKTIVFSADYDPNGKTTPTTTITLTPRLPFMFADGTGMYHNGARDYIPDQARGGGRYLQTDPVGLTGGLNTYVYGLNNPGKWTDRLGLDVVPPGYYDLYYNTPPDLSPQDAATVLGIYGFAMGGELPVAIRAIVAESRLTTTARSTQQSAGAEQCVIDVSQKPQGVPDNWLSKPTKGPGGTMYYDPANPGNSVRVMPGNPNSPYPNSQSAYVRWQQNGQALDINGNILPSSKAPEAHIPLKTFRFKGDIFQ